MAKGKVAAAASDAVGIAGGQRGNSRRTLARGCGKSARAKIAKNDWPGNQH